MPAFRRPALAMLAALMLALPARAADLTVFAASSLATALAAVKTEWEAAAGRTLTVSLAGSSALARQIEQGAPADVFISASPDWMDALEAQGLIRVDTRRDLLGNTLVLVAHGAGAAPVDLADLPGLLGEDRIAMALVDAVPAGIYGRAALTSLGLWDALAPRVAQTDNVRAALALVATGEAPFGIVYATDAAAEPRVSVVATFPGESHPPIVYPAAVTSDSAAPDAAAGFLDWLAGPDARPLFEREGFQVVPPR